MVSCGLRRSIYIYTREAVVAGHRDYSAAANGMSGHRTKYRHGIGTALASVPAETHTWRRAVSAFSGCCLFPRRASLCFGGVWYVVVTVGKFFSDGVHMSPALRTPTTVRSAVQSLRNDRQILHTPCSLVAYFALPQDYTTCFALLKNETAGWDSTNASPVHTLPTPPPGRYPFFFSI